MGEIIAHAKIRIKDTSPYRTYVFYLQFGSVTVTFSFFWVILIIFYLYYVKLVTITDTKLYFFLNQNYVMVKIMSDIFTGLVQLKNPAK